MADFLVCLGGRLVFNFYFWDFTLEGCGVCDCLVVLVDSKSNFFVSLLVRGAVNPIYVIRRLFVFLPAVILEIPT